MQSKLSTQNKPIKTICINYSMDTPKKGTYGCVYKPPLQCKTAAGIQAKKTVGKVFESKEWFKKELANMKLISDNIPNHDEFCILSSDGCELTDETISCNNGKFQIIYPDGGVDLDELSRTKCNAIPHNQTDTESKRIKNFRYILFKFRPILQGLQKFVENGFIHMDIKPSNLLYGTDTRSIKLIDFGLMYLKSELFDDTNTYDDLFDNDYIYFANELFIFNKLQQDLSVDQIESLVHKHILASSKFLHFKNEANTESITIFQLMQEMFDQNPLDEVKQFVRTASTQDFKTFVPKLDVYALGMTLLHIMRIFCLTRKAFRERSIQYSMISDDEYDFLDKAYVLIGAMIHFDPNKRCTVTDALNYFDSTLFPTRKKRYKARGVRPALK